MSDDSSYDYEDFEGYDEDIDEVYEKAPKTDEVKTKDLELGVFSCLNHSQVNDAFKEDIDDLMEVLPADVYVAKHLLYLNGWSIPDIIKAYGENEKEFLKKNQIRALKNEVKQNAKRLQFSKRMCKICFEEVSSEKWMMMGCSHSFCAECWREHVASQVVRGNATKIECMEPECDAILTEDFARDLVPNHLQDKYKSFSLKSYVESHPLLRPCAGPGCESVFRVWEVDAKKLSCTRCGFAMCFLCGRVYHLPASCEVIKMWLEKCRDDSETAHYLEANTKECPKCHTVIEKNGGCNHMSCRNCKKDFCWLCLGAWRGHTSCNTYKENSGQTVARAYLQKYLFYYERWVNHERSIRLEAIALEKAKETINEKVLNFEGLPSQWYYLLEAYSLLAVVRHTMKYSYPFVFYLQPGPKKALFEFQQAHTEEAIESLAFKLEQEELSDKSGIECRVKSLRIQRATLLQQFLKNSKTL